MSEKASPKKRILSVGLVCLDVVNVVRSYPVEDTDQRTLDQYSSRGGNASNSASVLAQLGEEVEYFGTLAEGALETELIRKDFHKFGIATDHCVRYVDVRIVSVCNSFYLIIFRPSSLEIWRVPECSSH